MKGGKYIECLKNIAVHANTSVRNLYSSEIINIAWTLDLIDRYEQIIKPYLEKDYIVILHRSELCCRVYSHLFSQGTYDIDSIIDKILGDFTLPIDLHFYLNIDPKVAYERILKRNKGEKITDKENLKKLQEAWEIYNKLLYYPQYSSVIKIDGEACLSKISEKIIAVLDDKLCCVKAN